MFDVSTFTGQAQRHLTIKAARLEADVPLGRSGGWPGRGFRRGVGRGEGRGDVVYSERVHSPRSIWLVPAAPVRRGTSGTAA